MLVQEMQSPKSGGDHDRTKFYGKYRQGNGKKADKRGNRFSGKAAFSFFLILQRMTSRCSFGGDWDNQDFERDIGVVFSHDKSGLA